MSESNKTVIGAKAVIVGGGTMGADVAVVLTRGGDGLMLMTRDGRRTDIPALPVKLISSHGAGDCFCGALAARLAAGEAIEAVCHFATEAAGRFVSTPQAG